MLKFDITRKVFTSVPGARTRYEHDLKDLKHDKKTSLKRKEEEISQLSAKVKRLTDDSEYLIRMAEEQSVEAEKKTSFNFIKKSNAAGTKQRRKSQRRTKSFRK